MPGHQLRLEISEPRCLLQLKASQIIPQDIPDSLQARAIHVAPIANELYYKAVDRL
ncbi:hypothetical protein GWO18_01600 [Candidatus Bathyarchaeota archaeon]|nr:hypothetical protein [Candidatus Bathyarchaeota archaeon]